MRQRGVVLEDALFEVAYLPRRFEAQLVGETDPVVLVRVEGVALAACTGAGHFYELEAIAAVILGGAALHGGEGRLWRSMMGILLLSALGNGLNIIGVHPHWKGVAIGAILIGAASLDAIKRRVR